jgi:hypothetical protein
LATWLNQVCPAVDPSLSAGGMLTFNNAAVDAHASTPAESYQLQWFRFDNATGTRTSVGEAQAVTTPAGQAPVPRLDGAEYVGVAVTARHRQHPGWVRPATFFFRRGGTQWTLVGVERG